MGLASRYSPQSSPRSGTIGPRLLLGNFTALDGVEQSKTQVPRPSAWLS